MMKRVGIVLMVLSAGCAGSDTSDTSFIQPPGAADGGAGGADGAVTTRPPAPGGGSDGGTPSSDDGGAPPSGGVDGGTPPPSGTDAGGPSDPGPASGGLAQGVTISQIAIFQGSKVQIAANGAATAPKYVPVVAGRAGLLRVYVASAPSKPLTAELTLTSSTGTTVLKDANRTLSGASTDGSLDTTFNIDIPQGTLAADTTFAVRVVDPSTPASNPSGSNPARYPTDGSKVSMGAKSDGDQITFTFVPVKYNADGSGRLPDTSADQMKIYTDFLSQTYPVAKLNIKVHAPYDYSGSIGATDSNGWGKVLDAINNLHDSENAPDNEYYYGIFQPAAPDAQGGASNYCRSGCILGIAYLAQGNGPQPHGAVGAGYKGLTYATTAAQEVGHSCGINHAPYPAQGQPNAPAQPDPNYPYSSAYIGQWGYGVVDHKLYDPASYRDFMSYASSKIWVSDYVQGLFFKRFKSDNGVKSVVGGPFTYYRVRVGGDGSLTWEGAVTLRQPYAGESRQVTFRDAAGNAVGTADAQYFAYDNLPGGSYLIPADAAPSFKSVRIDGPSASVYVEKQ